jgi:CBS domain-containing protein
MSRQIRDVMTAPPAYLSPDDTLVEAARAMRDEAIGDVLVVDAGRIAGVVTDRDIVVRAVAEGLAPDASTLAEVLTQDVVTVGPDEPVERAVSVMRERAVRRLPVCEGDQLVGVISLGDLAVEQDPESALADISASEPNV